MNTKIMDNILNLLNEKEKLFSEYEKATQNLLDCNVDSAEHYITQRGELATEVDRINDEIKLICAESDKNSSLLDAAFTRVEYSAVPKEMSAIFEKAQLVRSVAYRISGIEPQVVAHLEIIRDEAADKIKTNQNLPKIKKYLTDLTDKPSTNYFNSGKA